MTAGRESLEPMVVTDITIVSNRPAELPQAGVANLANALTVARLVMVPIFTALLLSARNEHTGWRLVATGVFVVASLTDRVDGAIARRRGTVTDFGKIADPIADKALIGAALISLSSLGDLPWWVTVVVLDARNRRDRTAVLGDPARCSCGQPRWQGEDGSSDRGDRAVPAAAHRCDGVGARVPDGGCDRHHADHRRRLRRACGSAASPHVGPSREQLIVTPHTS